MLKFLVHLKFIWPWLLNQLSILKYITVKTVTLGGFHFKPIFDIRKLKNHIYASFSSYRCNPSIIKSSFYRYASSLVACESTSRSSKFTVGIESGHDCALYGRVSSPSAKN